MSSGAAHSDLVSNSLAKSYFLLEAELIYSCTGLVYVKQNSLDGPLIGIVHIGNKCNLPVSYLKQIAFALESY